MNYVGDGADPGWHVAAVELDWAKKDMGGREPYQDMASHQSHLHNGWHHHTQSSWRCNGCWHTRRASMIHCYLWDKDNKRLNNNNITESFVCKWVMDSIGSRLESEQFGNWKGVFTTHCIIDVYHHLISGVNKHDNVSTRPVRYSDIIVYRDIFFISIIVSFPFSNIEISGKPIMPKISRYSPPLSSF